MIHHIQKWNFIAWVVLLAIGVGLEMYGIFSGRKSDTTMTALMCWWVPVYLRVMIVAWIAWHFVIQHPGRS